ncbi:aldehyde dehydrogenase family protein [Nakamurella endophytica]|uniref:Aldehyde dehydrogenase n=1 Tax=Nakamurella endophytica TaxID=1748367 RepID=A0A917SZ76_9ACTN|nr:aldehyde dehydrogenase family protein [Nakamurella endophytica]GGM04609.1 aldehyde dehydrogenase [Nakamurella endophytica]
MTAPVMPSGAAHWDELRRRTAVPTDLWIDGRWSAAAGRTPLVSPRDAAWLTDMAAADAADVDRAVAGARRAFTEWSALPPRRRGEILCRWADLLEQHRDELALLISLEMGKPISDAWRIEMRTTIGLVRWYGELADKLLDESPRGRPGATALVTREPVGVVGAITPWNFPMTLSAFKVPAALAAGNAVVVKPAEQSPLSILRAAELGSEAGLPDGVLQVVCGAGPVVGSALARHPGVDTLTFTGSTAVGRQLLADAGASNVKPVWLELGGKSANILFPDAPDRAEAVRTAAWAIAFNAGQMCTAGSRLLVHRSIHDEVVDGVVEHLRALRAGDPLDPATELGPMAGERHRRGVLDEIGRGKADGARLVTGSDTAPEGPGFFVEPAVFTGVDPDSRLAQHEIFGPVLSVLPFDDEDEAVRIANNSVYGLGAAVWTADLSRAQRMSRALAAGLVWVNCYEEGDQSVPFGGRKLSGFGTDKGVHGLEKFTQLKTTWIAF